MQTLKSQIRMGRAGLGWTINELGRQSNVGARTIKRIESEDKTVSPHLSTLTKLQTCLEADGIEFIGAPDDAPGIRIHSRQD